MFHGSNVDISKTEFASNFGGFSHGATVDISKTEFASNFGGFSHGATLEFRINVLDVLIIFSENSTLDGLIRVNFT